MSVENLDKLDFHMRDPEINILLLGETGVGKSTFINSLANYLSYKYIDRLDKEPLHVLIPATFKVKDKDNQLHDIQVGTDKDKNEYLEVGSSATQGVQPYVFGIYEGRVKVRVIDTPGIGDTRGIKQDDENCENIIGYVRNLSRLHAICFLFKPTVARLTAYFEYCLAQLLSRLDRTACKNLFFIFTNTRSTEYGPGDTLPILQKVVERIHSNSDGVMISLNKNIFCFDNEAFRYLAAVKKGVQFDKEISKTYRMSWESSAKQCWNLLKYINGSGQKIQRPLEPYNPRNLLAINVARSLLVKLSKILSKLFLDSATCTAQLDRYTKQRDTEQVEIDQLYKKGITIKDVEKVDVNYPILVCASAGCTEVHKVGDEAKKHYTKVCHMDCNDVSKIEYDIIGNPLISQCTVIDNLTRHCLRCGCDFSMHMHIKYVTKLKDIVYHDSFIIKSISEKEQDLSKTVGEMESLTAKNEELKEEQEMITSFCAKLARFLKDNAIMVFSDSFKDYILCLLNQKQLSCSSTTGETEEELKVMLAEFEQTKKVFNEMLSLEESVDWSDNPLKHIEDGLAELFSISSNKDLASLYENASNSSGSFKVDDYVHDAVYKKKDYKKKFDKENAKMQWKDKQNKKKANSGTHADKKETKKKEPNQGDKNNDGAIPKKQPKATSKKSKTNEAANTMDKKLKDASAEELKELLEQKLKLMEKEKASKAKKDGKGQANKPQKNQRSRTPPPPYTPSEKSIYSGTQGAAAGHGIGPSTPENPPSYYSKGNYVSLNQKANNQSLSAGSSKSTYELKVTINDNRGISRDSGPSFSTPPQPPFPLPPGCFPPPPPPGGFFPPPPMMHPGGPQGFHGPPPPIPPPHFSGMGPLPPPPQKLPQLPPNKQFGNNKNSNNPTDGKKGKGAYRGGGRGGFKPHFKSKKGGKKQNDSDDSDTSVSSKP